MLREKKSCVTCPPLQKIEHGTNCRNGSILASCPFYGLLQAIGPYWHSFFSCLAKAISSIVFVLSMNAFSDFWRTAWLLEKFGRCIGVPAKYRTIFKNASAGSNRQYTNQGCWRASLYCLYYTTWITPLLSLKHVDTSTKLRCCP